MTASERALTRKSSRRSVLKGSAARLGLLMMAASVVLSNSGCISFMANMIKVVKGTDAPAEFDDLKEKKVALVVSTPAGINADATGIVVSNYVFMSLAKNVKKIHLVSQEEVGRIISDLPSNERDMTLIGKRLNVDYVVAIDVSNLRLREGQTLYRGKSTTSVDVYNIAEGSSPVFHKTFAEHVYPQTGVPVTDVDESTFQNFYLNEISRLASRIFYPYDPSEDVAKDAAVASLQSLR